jgi:hypothetical protein
MGIVAAGAGRLSAIAISSAFLASKRADAGEREFEGHRHCFGRGTLILTARGEVPVEDLAIGEPVMTTNGALPVKWVGRRTIRRNGSASWHPSVMPIRVARFAIDDQTPKRDLYLSQEHSLLIDGFLIPVKHLINESSIAVDHEAKTSETIEYFSVELEAHQVIFAEGTAAETFRYCGGQIAWDNLWRLSRALRPREQADAGVCAAWPRPRGPRRGARLAPVGSLSFRRPARSNPDCLCPDREPGNVDRRLNGPTTARPYVSATMAAGAADEARLNVGYPFNLNE